MPRERNAGLKRRLQDEIVTGVLRPGTRLDEASLAARFNVSRTPVREALLQLSSAGLVEMRPRRGAVVASIGLKQLLEMFEVMAELEGMCGRLAARRDSPDECDALRAVHEAATASADAKDPEAYYHLNVRFHEAIYAMSRNAFLAEETLKLRNRLAPYRRLQLRQPDRIANSFREHLEVLEAIAAHDADRAEASMQAHVATQGGTFNDFVASLPADMVAAVSHGAARAGE